MRVLEITDWSLKFGVIIGGTNHYNLLDVKFFHPEAEINFTNKVVENYWFRLE